MRESEDDSEVSLLLSLSCCRMHGPSAGLPTGCAQPCKRSHAWPQMIRAYPTMQVTGEQPSALHANGDEELKEDNEPLSAAQSGLHMFLERSRYIPLRLSADERRYLHLLEAALSVSAYTDKVQRRSMSMCFCNTL
jgi:hypothetical protein